MRNTELKQNPEVEDKAERKGVIPRLLGVVAIIVGTLDSMLSWRGGFEVEPLYIGLILGGIALYITGSLAYHR